LTNSGLSEGEIDSYIASSALVSVSIRATIAADAGGAEGAAKVSRASLLTSIS
jgi:hypothetical protein